MGDQKMMLKIFTSITTSGVLAIPIIGYLMDTSGFISTCIVTLFFSLAYSLLLLWPGKYQLLTGFASYAFFRTSLFTYFFAYLADALGFRYFGILAGVSFFLSGLASLIQAPLMDWASGTCHLQGADLDTCDNGNWPFLYYVQSFCFLCLFLIPIFDRREEAQKQFKYTFIQ